MDMNLDGELAALTPEPAPTAEAKSGKPAPSQPFFGVPDMPGLAQVAACPVPDYDGTVVTRADCDYWVVEAFDADTEERLFYSDSREAGAICGAWLPLGTRVTVRASWGNQDCALLHWRSGFQASQGATCDCEQSHDPVCNFVVSHSTYCGAVFGLQGE
jgi:hypothetical protein